MVGAFLAYKIHFCTYYTYCTVNLQIPNILFVQLSKSEVKNRTKYEKKQIHNWPCILECRYCSNLYLSLDLNSIGWDLCLGVLCVDPTISLTWSGLNLYLQSFGIHPRSWTCSQLKLNLPFLPNASTSGGWQINFIIMSVFLISVMWYQLNLPLLSLTWTLLPWIWKILKSTLYLGITHLLVWSLTNTRSTTVMSGLVTGCCPSMTHSLAILRLCICVWKI